MECVVFMLVPQALDLMEKMLKFNPRKRITVDEALAHPYFTALHNPETEPACPEPFDFSFEQVRVLSRRFAVLQEHRKNVVNVHVLAGSHDAKTA